MLRVGNQTECALLDFVNSSLASLQRIEKSYSDFQSKFKVLKMIPFNSETKKMTVVIEIEPERKVRVFTKGASENIVDDCAYIFVKGEVSPGGSVSNQFVK